MTVKPYAPCAFVARIGRCVTPSYQAGPGLPAKGPIVRGDDRTLDHRVRRFLP